MPEPGEHRLAADLISRIGRREVCVGVIGLGYVGTSLAVAVGKAGFSAIGFDTDSTRTERLNQGIAAPGGDDLPLYAGTERFRATDDFEALALCDIAIICVQTPLGESGQPDLSFVENAARAIARRHRANRLVVLESTSYPGTTREVLKPILEAAGCRSEIDFLLGCSPERADPGNREHPSSRIPRIVSGDGPLALAAMEAFYRTLVGKVVTASSPEAAEAAKLT
ncbi:hypothetical protein BH10PSE9_BH10PSE9_04060 [soil metagenome]